jgi:hypothetical protein
MDSWPSAWERANENVEIVYIAGQNRLRKFDSESYEMCVHYVGRARLRKDHAYRPAVGQRVNCDRRQESCKACLTTAVAPYLCDNRMGCVQWSVSLDRSMQELLGGAFTTVDGHQKAGVQNHKS